METVSLAYLIGALRDGCFTIDKKQSAYRLRIYQKSKEWLEKIARILKRSFRKEPTFYLDKRKNVWCLTLSSKRVIERLLAISDYNFDQTLWLTPRWILDGDIKFKAAYKWLF
jgi:hypothetical protein